MRASPAFLLAALLCTGCQTLPLHTTYDPVGYKPKNPNNVVIKVSLQNRMVYVMEGNRPLLVTATAIGTPSNPTPKGRYRVTRKIENKRSNTYGFWVKGGTIVAGKSSRSPGTGYRYVGFPMQVLGRMDARLWISRRIGLADSTNARLLAPASKRRPRVFCTRPHGHPGLHCSNPARGRHTWREPAASPGL